MYLLTIQGRKFFPTLKYCLLIKGYFSSNANTYILKDTMSKCVHSTCVVFLLCVRFVWSSEVQHTILVLRKLTSKLGKHYLYK